MVEVARDLFLSSPVEMELPMVTNATLTDIQTVYIQSLSQLSTIRAYIPIIPSLAQQTWWLPTARVAASTLSVIYSFSE